MIDLSAYPCPLCGNTNGNSSVGVGCINHAYCGSCRLAIEGPEGTERSSIEAWIVISKAVHGKKPDGPTVDVRIAVAVDDKGNVDAELERAGEDPLQELEIDLRPFKHMMNKWLAAIWISGFILGFFVASLAHNVVVGNYIKSGIMVQNGTTYDVTPMKKEGGK